MPGCVDGSFSGDAQVAMRGHTLESGALTQRKEDRTHLAALPGAKLQVVAPTQHRATQGVLSPIVVER